MDELILPMLTNTYNELLKLFTKGGSGDSVYGCDPCATNMGAAHGLVITLTREEGVQGGFQGGSSGK